jgi:hypothetical protein
MAIIVVCPGCRKSFKVSDQFAGRSGPCPSCKKIIQVPTKAQEVKVHAPEEFEGGGRSTSGKLVIKPVAFQPTRANPVTVAMIVATIVVTILAAWAGGRTHLFNNLLATAVGLLIVSPLLVAAAYSVLRDAELEPYSGKQLYVRSSLCALGYMALWGIFALLSFKGFITGDYYSWLYVVPPFVVTGALFSMAAFDLPFGDGALHFGFYLVATVILRWIAGLHWVWDVAHK